MPDSPVGPTSVDGAADVPAGDVEKEVMMEEDKFDWSNMPLFMVDDELGGETQIMRASASPTKNDEGVRGDGRLPISTVIPTREWSASVHSTNAISVPYHKAVSDMQRNRGLPIRSSAERPMIAVVNRSWLRSVQALTSTLPTGLNVSPPSVGTRLPVPDVPLNPAAESRDFPSPFVFPASILAEFPAKCRAIRGF